MQWKWEHQQQLHRVVVRSAMMWSKVTKWTGIINHVCFRVIFACGSSIKAPLIRVAVVIVVTTKSHDVNGDNGHNKNRKKCWSLRSARNHVPIKPVTNYLRLQFKFVHDRTFNCFIVSNRWHLLLQMASPDDSSPALIQANLEGGKWQCNVDDPFLSCCHLCFVSVVKWTEIRHYSSRCPAVTFLCKLWSGSFILPHMVATQKR